MKYKKEFNYFYYCLFDFPLDGEHIAIASHDGSIYVHAVYDEGTTYRRVGCCSVSSLVCLDT